MSVSGIVVTHGPSPDLRRCLDSLAPQVDELLVIANVPLTPELPANARLLTNESPVGFGANVNRGVTEARGDFVVIANPDTKPAPDVVRILRDFAAGPGRLWRRHQPGVAERRRDPGQSGNALTRAHERGRVFSGS